MVQNQKYHPIINNLDAGSTSKEEETNGRVRKGIIDYFDAVLEKNYERAAEVDE
jgi:hypothetical protein